MLSCSLQSRDLLRVRSKHIRKFCLSQFQFSTTKGKTSHHSIERGNNGDPPLAQLSRTGRIRTCNQGIMRTDYGFHRPFRVCGLDHTFTRTRTSQYHLTWRFLVNDESCVCRLVSTPSAATFVPPFQPSRGQLANILWLQLGSGLACVFQREAFPEFDRFYPLKIVCSPKGNPLGRAMAKF